MMRSISSVLRPLDIVQHRNTAHKQVGNLAFVQQRKKSGHSLEQCIRVHRGFLVLWEIKHCCMANNIPYVKRVVHGH